LLHDGDILKKETIETVVDALVDLAAQQSNHSMVFLDLFKKLFLILKNLIKPS